MSSVTKQPLLYQTTFFLLALPLAIPLLYFVSLFFRYIFSLHFPLHHVFPSAIIFQFIVELALVSYLFLVLTKKEYGPVFTKTHLLLLAFAGLLLFTSLWSLDPPASILSDARRADGVLFLFHVGLYLFLLSWVIKRPIFWEFLFQLALFIGILTLFLTFLIPLLSGVAIPLAKWENAAANPFGNTNFFAHYILLLLGINTYFLLQRPRLWNILLFLPFLGFLFVIRSSSAFFLAIFLTVALLWFFWRNIFYGFALFGSALFLYLIITGNSYAASIFNVRGSFLSRWYTWQDAVQTTLTKSAFFGFGWGNNDIMWNFATQDSFATIYGDERFIVFDKMHNALIEFFVAAGPFGLILFLFFWGRVLGIALIDYKPLCAQGAKFSPSGKWFVSRRQSSAAQNKKEGKPISLFFFLVFLVHIAFLMFNFDTLMSYLVVSMLLAAFISTYEKPYFGLVFLDKKRHLLFIAVSVIIGYSLYQYHVKPLQIYFLATQAHAKIIAPFSSPLDTKALFQSLDKTISLSQPYDLLLNHVAAIFKEMPERIPLLLKEQNSFYLKLRHIYQTLALRHPYNPEHYYELASLERRFAVDLDAMEGYLKEALRLAPHRGLFRLQLALVYFDKGDIGKAREILEELKVKHFYPGRVNFYLGALDIKEGRVEAGKRKVLKALPRYNPEFNDWHNLFKVFEKSRSTKEALTWYQELLAFSQFDINIYAHIIYLARKLGDEKLAQAYFTQIQKIMPEKERDIISLLLRLKLMSTS